MTNLKIDTDKQIGEIGNYYGELHVTETNRKYYWGIENWEETNWQEITKELYDALVKFEDEKNDDKQMGGEEW